MSVGSGDAETRREDEAADAAWIESAVAGVRERTRGGGGEEDEKNENEKCPAGAGEIVPEAKTVATVAATSSAEVTMVDVGKSLEQERQQTGGFHSGESRYTHLSTLSMDDICARVVLYGVRPAEEHA